MTESETASAYIALVDSLCWLLSPADYPVAELETSVAALQRSRSRAPNFLVLPPPGVGPFSPQEPLPRVRSQTMLGRFADEDEHCDH